MFEDSAPGLLRLSRHLTGDLSDAEDLLQSTFVTAMRKASDYDPARPLQAWLSGILQRHAQELRAKARRQIDPERVSPPADSPDPVDVARRRELSDELYTAIERLPSSDRSLLLLELRHGLGAAEIAEVLDRAPGTVRVQLHRARERLRRLLPAGVASTVTLGASVRAARGLPAIQREVLALAMVRSRVALPLGALALQVLSMKLLTKSGALVAAVLLLSIGAVFAIDAGGGRSDPNPERSEAQRAGVGTADGTTADAEQGADAASGSRRIAAASGSSGRAVAADGGAVVLQTVRLADSAPLGGVALIVEPDDARHPVLHRRLLTTDTDGRVVVRDLAPGAYRVLADRPLRTEAPVDPEGMAELDAQTDTEREELFHASMRDLPETRLPPHEEIRRFDFFNLRMLQSDLPPDAPRLQVSGYIDLSSPDPDTVAEISADEDGPALVRMDRFVVDESAEGPDDARIAARFVISGQDPVGDPIERTIRLPGGVVVQGLVHSSEGLPASDVEVCLVAPGDLESHGVVARTDSEGRFVCTDVAPGSRLFARGGEAQLRSRAATIEEGMDELVLKLRAAAGQVRGTVRDPFGEPVTGARVRFGNGYSARGIVRVETDEEGRFGPVGLYRFESMVLVQEPGFEPWGARIMVAEGSEHDLDIQLERGWTFRGQVLEADQPGGSGLVVRAVGEEGATTSTVTDDEGRVLFECLPVGNVRFEVAQGPAWSKSRDSFRGGPGEELIRDLRRPRAGQIRLEVVSEGGEPLVDWMAKVIPEDQESGESASTRRVGGDGLVTFETRPELMYRIELQPGSRELLEITLGDGTKKRFVCHQLQPWMSPAVRRVSGEDLGIDRIPGLVDRLRVVVPRRFHATARLRGRLVDAMGNPVTGSFQVTANDKVGWAVLIEDDGLFDTGFLVPGPYAFKLRALKPEPGEEFTLDVKELLPSQNLQVGDVLARPR